jgi:hypothetical protein
MTAFLVGLVALHLIGVTALLVAGIAELRAIRRAAERLLDAAGYCVVCGGPHDDSMPHVRASRW